MKCLFSSLLGCFTFIIVPWYFAKPVFIFIFRDTVLYCIVEETSKGLDRTSALAEDGLVLDSPPANIFE